MHRVGFLRALIGFGFIPLIPKEEATKIHRHRMDGALLSNKVELKRLQKKYISSEPVATFYVDSETQSRMRYGPGITPQDAEEIQSLMRGFPIER